jgi:tetratricopeptide (TPR) repeat protein
MGIWRRRRQRGSGLDAIAREHERRGGTVLRMTDAEAEDMAIAVSTQMYQAGDVQGAVTSLRTIVAQGRPGPAAVAAFNLGVILEERGDLFGAQEAYEAALEAPDAKLAAQAALNLGNLFAQHGQPFQLYWAKALLLRVMDVEDPELVGMAAVGLGWVLAKLDEREAALATWQRAVDSGQAEDAHRAQLQMGAFLALWDRKPEAVAALEAVVRSGHPELAPKAQASLDHLRSEPS